MSRALRKSITVIALAASCSGTACFAAPSRAAPRAPLRAAGAAVSLPGVEGRIDHMAFDAATNRLFVAAIANGSVEVVDLSSGSRAARIDGLHEPQGVAFLPSVQRLVVTDGGDASVLVFGSKDLAREHRVSVRDDADNMRVDGDGTRVWFGEGSGERGALAELDPVAGKIVAEVPLDGHPEAFELAPGGARIFVNVPQAREVEVVDRARGAVVARWKLSHAANFPMALDGTGGRLLVGCREPARLLVLDPKTGDTIEDLDAPRDVDDIFIDAARGCVYVSAGQGVVRVYADHGGRLAAAGDVATRPGARTSLFVPGTHRLYVAAPASGKTNAEILVFDTTTPK